MNNNHHIMKILCTGQIVVIVLLVSLCFFMRDDTPIVVTKNGQNSLYSFGEREVIQITKNNIKDFIQKYIFLRYEWGGELNVKEVVKRLEPLTTDGFKRKTAILLDGLRTKDFKGKSLDQGHTLPRVVVNDKSTTASFDRVLRINGVSLVIPTQISFSLVKGEKTVWNELGLYVNGTTIHEQP